MQLSGDSWFELNPAATAFAASDTKASMPVCFWASATALCSTNLTIAHITTQPPSKLCAITSSKTPLAQPRLHNAPKLMVVGFACHLQGPANNKEVTMNIKCQYMRNYSFDSLTGKSSFDEKMHCDALPLFVEICA